MFAKDINRSINGVIKVNQDDEDILRQEVDEYVITEELQKHFRSFFDFYRRSFANHTGDIGVWISGEFGSGKSHFLKILSYLLDSRQSVAYHVKESFQQKLADAPDIYENIDAATQGETETILFNIDIEGPGEKDKTAVLRVFTKMFYNHLGFYGEDLKTARFEQFLSKKGKLAEFQRVFEEKLGESWAEARDAFAFHEDEVVAAMQDVLGMSEASARDWFNGASEEQFSIAQLVREIKDYVDTKPQGYRLLFMIDEVGQYIGTDHDMLLNFQSITEELGTKCGNSVWVMATGQELLDKLIKVRQDEFSKIMGRFKTRLSLSSSSVDEVIERRLLEKTPDAKAHLADVYKENAASIENLFVFKDAKSDIRAYRSCEEFQRTYPFAPYQFLLLQKTYKEVRTHGNAGKHLASGERSMLSGFQEVAQKIQHQDETALAPFYRFYDSMVTFLDSSIRRVIDRCEKAAKHGDGLEPFDVDVLKCLYLILYLKDDIPANAENVMVLMADRIAIDKIVERRKIQESLDRLLRQNYVGRTGDTFQFLTDEEQDMQREIAAEEVAPSRLTDYIGRNIIFSDIYSMPKYRYDIYDFPFTKMIDDVVIGVPVQQGMKLEFLTEASDVQAMSEMELIGKSAGQALIVLSPDSHYYTQLEEAMKILQYIDHNTGKAASAEVRVLLSIQEAKASELKARVMDDVKKAIEQGRYYVDGERLALKAGEARTKINHALEYLVKHTYSKLDYITKHAETDDDIRRILHGESQRTLTGQQENALAMKDIADHLDIQDQQQKPTTMADIQSRYQATPYGWREIDIAAVTAQLLDAQAITLKRSGVTLRADDPALVSALRKRTLVGSIRIEKRRQMNQKTIKKAVDILEEYLHVMNIPKDNEDKLVAFITEKLGAKLVHYERLKDGYHHMKYPDGPVLDEALHILRGVLAKQSDDFALVDALAKASDDIYDLLDDLENVENFFSNQSDLFEEGVHFEGNMRRDIDYIRTDEDARKKLDRIRAIITVEDGKRYDYDRIPELQGLIRDVRAAHDQMLEKKRRENNDIITECMKSIYDVADEREYVKEQVSYASDHYQKERQRIGSIQSVVELSGISNSWFDYKDRMVDSIQRTIDHHEHPEPVVPEPPKPDPKTQPKKKTTSVDRRLLCPTRQLTSDAQIDAYVETIRKELHKRFEGVDVIFIK